TTKAWQADRKVVQSPLFEIGLAGIIALAGGPTSMLGRFVTGAASGAASIGIKNFILKAVDYAHGR
ncbi:hypothetical protein, partial [Thermosipho sp. 1244]